MVVLLALMQLTPAAHAKRHNYQLPDGVNVVMDVQSSQTVITLTGESKSIYRLECSTDLQQWTTLDNRMKLESSGSFTYTDARTLPKCFYRIGVLHLPIP